MLYGSRDAAAADRVERFSGFWGLNVTDRAGQGGIDCMLYFNPRPRLGKDATHVGSFS